MNIITVLLFITFFFFTKKGVKGAETLARWIAPLIFKYFFFSFSDINDAPPRLDRGLNGTVGGASSISLQGTRAMR